MSSSNPDQAALDFIRRQLAAQTDDALQGVLPVGTDGKVHLPPELNSLPYIKPPSNLVAFPRLLTQPKALTDDENALADEYAAAYELPLDREHVVQYRAPKLKTERDKNKMEAFKRRLERQAKRYEQLQNAFQGREGDRMKAQSAYLQRQKYNAYPKRMEKYRERYGTPEGFRTYQQSQALKNIAKRLPGSISNAKYLQALSDPSIAGLSSAQLPEQLKGFWRGDWRGKAPQTLSPDDRNAAMMNLANIVGILNVAPEFDVRLTSPASAAQVYDPRDYDIQTYDLDDNVLTPGTVIITTKYDQTAYDGSVIPAGQIVAVGGYKLPDPSGARSTRNLQMMQYQQLHPTRDERISMPYSDWMAMTYPKKRTTPHGMKAIVDHIKMILFDVMQPAAVFPQRVSVDGKIKEMPTYMKLIRAGATDGSTVALAYYKVNKIQVNAICSRIAELFFNLGICPQLLGELKGSNIFIDAFKNACNEPVEFKYIASDGKSVESVLKLNRSVDSSASDLGIRTDQYIMSCWRASYFHPKVLSALLAYKTIKDKVDAIIASMSDPLNTASIKTQIGVFHDIMKVVMIHTMNSNFESFLDDLVQGTVTNDTLQLAIHVVTPMIEFRFLDEKEISNVIIPGFTDTSAINVGGTLVPFYNLTSRAWDNDVRIVYNISARGEAAIDPKYHGKVYDDVVGFKNPKLYEAGRAANKARADELNAEWRRLNPSSSEMPRTPFKRGFATPTFTKASLQLLNTGSTTSSSSSSSSMSTPSITPITTPPLKEEDDDLFGAGGASTDV